MAALPEWDGKNSTERFSQWKKIVLAFLLTGFGKNLNTAAHLIPPESSDSHQASHLAPKGSVELLPSGSAGGKQPDCPTLIVTTKGFIQSPSEAPIDSQPTLKQTHLFNCMLCHVNLPDRKKKQNKKHVYVTKKRFDPNSWCAECATGSEALIIWIVMFSGTHLFGRGT